MVVSEVVRSMVFLFIPEVMRSMVNLTVAMRLVVNLTIAAMRLVNTSVRLVNRLVNAGVRSMRFVDKLLFAVAVNKVRFPWGVALNVRLVLNLTGVRTAVRSVDALSRCGLRRHALFSAAGAAARLLAGFAAAGTAAGSSILMRVVSIETTFVKASLLGFVIIEAASLGSVCIETAAGSVLIERAALGSVIVEAAASRLVVIEAAASWLVVIEAAALGLVSVIATVRVGSVGILDLVDNVDRLDRLKFVLSLTVGSGLLLGPRVLEASVRTSVVLGSLSSGN